MKLRPYQEEDVANILDKECSGVGVFNEQRTGKTPTSLVAMDAKAGGRIVVISPASMVLKWAEEATTWTNRPVYAYIGTKKQREFSLSQYSQQPHAILIISYDLFKTTKTSDGLKDIIKKTKPEGLIVDESHRAVGRKTANFKSLRTLVKIPHRLYLTGTPAPNHPAQVWALLTMIDPQNFSSYWAFAEEFFKIEEQRLPSYVTAKSGKNHIQTVGDFRSESKKKEYTELLHSYCIMRKRADVMPWLPKDEPPTRIKLPLSAQQEKYLKELTEFFETEHVITQGILDQLLRYRQICLAPEILDLKGTSPKLDWLKSYTSDYPDKSIVVFSRFTQFLRLAQKKLGDVGVIVGDTKLNVRKLLIDSFQDGKIRILLIQIDAGKEGLTLDQADTLIFTDTYPPASDILQARDRIVATTEGRNKPKEIIELCHSDSYDEALYDLVDLKIEHTDLANNYIKYIKERSEG